MKVRVKYVDFHWDNYQGASGKSFEFYYTLVLPLDLEASDIKDYIFTETTEHAIKNRPFRQDEKIAIQEIQIL